jgi:hypothetical protein
MEVILRPLRFVLSCITTLLIPPFNWWRPIRISPLFGINMNYRESSVLRNWTSLTTPYRIHLPGTPLHPSWPRGASEKKTSISNG